MNTRPIAVVLGGTAAHIALIESLRRRGYHVLLADYLDTPPAAGAADEHVRISTLDTEAVTRLARTRGATLVIATSVDRANVAAAADFPPAPGPCAAAKRSFPLNAVQRTPAPPPSARPRLKLSQRLTNTPETKNPR